MVTRICAIQEQTIEKWLPRVKTEIHQQVAKLEEEIAAWVGCCKRSFLLPHLATIFKRNVTTSNFNAQQIEAPRQRIWHKKIVLNATPKKCPDCCGDGNAKRRRLMEIIGKVDQTYFKLAHAVDFRDDDPQLNISARVRQIFQRMKKNTTKGIPKFLDAASHKEIARLLKETRSHGLPNFVCDAVFSHMVKTQILPHLAQNGRALIQEISHYISDVRWNMKLGFGVYFTSHLA
jgi:hypothetical protein